MMLYNKFIRRLKGGVRAEPLYEVNFFYEAFTARIQKSLNSLSSSLSLYRERERERERETS